jgi:hypothetical protein
MSSQHSDYIIEKLKYFTPESFESDRMGNTYEVSIQTSSKIDPRKIGVVRAKETFYTAPYTRTAFTYTHVLSSSDIGMPFDVLVQEAGWKKDFYLMAKIVSVNPSQERINFQLEEIDDVTRNKLLEKIRSSQANA